MARRTERPRAIDSDYLVTPSNGALLVLGEFFPRQFAVLVGVQLLEGDEQRAVGGGLVEAELAVAVLVQRLEARLTLRQCGAGSQQTQTCQQCRRGHARKSDHDAFLRPVRTRVSYSPAVVPSCLGIVQNGCKREPPAA